jgi:tRNA A-37 threonylcarbamoyl transferase component Bud32
MILAPTSRVRVMIPSFAVGTEVAGAKARSIARAVCAESFGASARVIKSDDRTTVLVGEAAGYPVVVKTLALDRAVDRLRSVARLTRHWRQARGAVAVAEAGLRVAKAYAIVRGVDPSGHRVEALVLERIEGPTLLRVASERVLKPDDRRLLLDRVGEGVGKLVRAGRFNRDHKPSNIIVATDEGGRPVPVLIDTSDIRRARGSGSLDEMLAKLLIEALGASITVAPRDQLRVARGALKSSAQRRELRDVLASIEGIIASHGDPTPKDDPLAFDA